MVSTSLFLLLFLLTLLSIRYWFLLIKAKSITPVFPLNPNRCQLEMSLPVILVILWISLRFAGSIVSKWQTTTIKSNLISLDAVIESCMTTFSFGVILLFILVISNRNSLQKLGFRVDDQLSQIRDGSIGFLLSLIPVMALLLLTQSVRSEETLHPLFLLLKEQPHISTIIWIFISAVIVAPLVEELIYRVILQSWLEDFLHPFVAILVSSLVFSIVHGFPDCIPLFPLAFVLGTLFYYRRSYVAVVITHVLFNSINLAIALSGQS